MNSHSRVGVGHIPRASLSLADIRSEDLRPHIAQARKSGCSSLRQIAAFLNESGLRTSGGRLWGASQVSRAIRRMAQAESRSRSPAALSLDELGRLVGQARDAGFTSLRQIGSYLDRQGVRTPRGSEWHPMGVKRTLRLIAGERTAREKNGGGSPDPIG